MSDDADSRRSKIAAVVLVAATYFYFLIFAEFAFLELVRVAVSGTELRLIMAALGVGGMVGAAGMAAVFRLRRARMLLTWILRVCAAGAGLALVAQGVLTCLSIGFLCGAALGALTVGVASVLRDAIGPGRLGFGLGMGTGVAYALCNLPWLFRARPSVQTGLAALAVLLASFAVRFIAIRPEEQPVVNRGEGGEFIRWTIVLLALVWLDSAAFYIIQHTPSLRVEMWDQTRTLWMNAGVHLAGALIAGAWLDRGRRELVVGIAITTLGLGGLALGGWLPAWLAPGVLYTGGVSFYSVALVEIPARSRRPWVAAMIFGVAGWTGSALGIGMAEDLAHIPIGFIGAAAIAVAGALLWRRRKLVGVVAAFVACLGKSRADEVQIGREVYIAEGCIHCHSQYVRSQVPSEVLNWGPATRLAESLSAQPPLFGTRRQGPDLSRVGNRRSFEWNRLHLVAPQAISPKSRMPSYAHLFAPGDNRGDALLAYLASLGSDTFEERQKQIAAWQPATREANAPAVSARLFQQLCAQCHGTTGHGDGALAARLSVKPPNWTTEPWRHVSRTGDNEVAICRIIKFGLPGLPMAGHEYLSDPEIVGLARHVGMLRQAEGGVSLAAVPP
jgi:cytochrome c553